VADGNQAFVIVLAPAVSLDPAYSGMDGQDVNGLNQDGRTWALLAVWAAGLLALGAWSWRRTPAS